MLRNYFKIAYRSLVRNKVFSIINISGLSIGMASAMLILLWIQNEVSYDRFHTKSDRLFEAWSLDQKAVDGKLNAFTPTPEILGPALKAEYPDLEAVTRVQWPNTALFAAGDKSIKATGLTVDTAFLNIFSFPLLAGDPQTALKDPYSIIVTEKMAIKLFGSLDVIGKTVKIDNVDNLTVSAIAKNPPANTDFKFEYLLSYDRITAKGWVDNDWTDFSIRTFVLLKPNVSAAATNEKIKHTIVEHSGGRAHTDIFLYPVSQLRLYSNFENGKPSGGRIETVRILGIIAGFILLIACINFMNLTTARSEKRAKEVGIRKVAGAIKSSLVMQFLSESVLMAFIAGLFALLIVYLVLPAFNQLTEKDLILDYRNFSLWLAFAAFILFTGILAGSYPSFFLSAFKPVAVLKGSFKKVNALVTPRKVLVVLQFTFAIVLIVCTIIVSKQIHYGTNKKTGYDRTNMIYVFLEGDLRKNYDLVKTDLINAGIASSVSQSHAPLTQVWSSGHSLSWKGKDLNNPKTFLRSSTDGDLIKTAGFKLVEGRDIDLKTYPSDSVACIINETAAKLMGFKEVIGQTIYDDPTTWHVIGVIKDFILESPFEPIKPMIIKGPRSQRNVLNIKLTSGQNTASQLAKAEKIFKQYNPAYPFEYYFMDEEYAKKFTNEQLTARLAGIFSGLTIFISCLGLFGLATYMAEARIKEIGIRKVLGASVTNITKLLSMDFLKLIVISILISTPIAWWSMTKWLHGYEYRVNIDWKIFLAAGSFAIIIALMTVSYQAIRAAIANPVRSLKEM